MQKSTRTALKDARQTVYVNGRWIWANDHVLYRIVLRSVLPSDGDYLSYFKDSNKKDDKLKDESHQFDDFDRHLKNQLNQSKRNNPLWASTLNPSTIGSSSILVNQKYSIDKHAILSSLTYTVQFVNLIAFYLNIVLPYNLHHK